jgi:hypothetical protein
MDEFLIAVDNNSLQQARRSKGISSLKCYRADISVKMWKLTDVSDLIYLTISLIYQTINNILKLGTGSVSETSEDFHTFMQLSTLEHLIDFCRHENFKTDKYICVNCDPKTTVFKKTKG